MEVYDGHKLLNIGEKSVQFQRLSDNELVEFQADYVIMSLGVRPNRELWADIRAQYGAKSFLIGDVGKTGMIHDAVFSGFNAGWNLDAIHFDL